MSAKAIVGGTGNNSFSPQGDAAREQALIIAAHMATGLKDTTPEVGTPTVPTQPTTPTTPTQPTTPPSSGNTGVVGVWVPEDPFKSVESANEWVEFKADGTFYSYLYITGVSGSGWLGYTFSDPGTFTAKGNYSVSGNTIKLTSVLSSWKAKNPQAAMTKDYTNKPDSNMTWEYEYLPSGSSPVYPEYDALRISGWTVSGSGKRYYHPRTANGIELWPQVLPSFLYPTGFNGVAQSEVRSGTMDMANVANAFGKDTDYLLTFSVTIHNTTMAALQTYRNQLTSNGFEGTFESSIPRWIFEGTAAINGVEYQVDVRMSDANSSDSSILIIYEFR
jgi:hypothetical protein